MVNVLTDIRISQPLHVVAGYAADPDNAPNWYVNIKSVTWKTPKPLSVGSQVAFIARFMGKELAYTYEMTEYIPGLRLVMRTAEGPFPMETTYTWESIDANSTKMTLQNRGMPAGFSKLLTPFMTAAMRRANTKDLRKLKDILEHSISRYGL